MQLSILIPTYNFICTRLVMELKRQADTVEGLEYEIVVVDDGSTDSITIEANKAIEKLSNCRIDYCKRSKSRSAMRNQLWRHAKFDWQLQLNSNVNVASDSFIRNYIDNEKDCKVVAGTISFPKQTEALTNNLRYIYEHKFSLGIDTDWNNKHPYAYFRNTNCMYHRSVFDLVSYDESVTTYGYEDSLFGHALKKADIPIHYIDNPVSYDNFENNSVYIQKIEESLGTLIILQDQIGSTSPLIRIINILQRLHLKWIICLWHKFFGEYERCNLTGNKPNLFIFQLFKLGFVCTNSNNNP